MQSKTAFFYLSLWSLTILSLSNSTLCICVLILCLTQNTPNVYNVKIHFSLHPHLLGFTLFGSFYATVIVTR